MKKYFIKTIIIALAFVTMFGCQNDDFLQEKNETAISNNSKRKVERLSLDKLNKDSKIYNILSQRFLNLANENQEANFRTIIGTDYGFSIDTDDFIYIEEDENHSYTFQVVKDSLASLENLILNYNLESESYDAYLIEYLIDEVDEENIINNEEISDFISKTKVSYLPNFNSESLLQQRTTIIYVSTCTYTVTQEIVFTPGLYGGGVYEAIPVYTLVSCTYNYTIIGDGGSSGAPVYQIEEGSGRNNGGGGGPQNPNNPSVGDNNSGNTNNGGVGFGDGNGNIVTTPVKNLIITTASSLFFNALNSAQNANLKMWWNVPENYLPSNHIVAYLNANNTTPQNMQNASDFSLNMINQSVSNQFYGAVAQGFIISQVFKQSLTPAQQSWWNNPNNAEAVTQIIGYLGQNGLNPIYNNNTPRIFNTQSWNFAIWATGFFTNNPNTTWGQLENYFSINDNIDYDLFNELKNLPVNTLEEFIEINDELSSFNSTIQADSFDPLGSSWMKKAREYATRLEEWSSSLGPKAKQKANELIDKTFVEALKKTAKEIYPSVGWLNESQKQTQFQTNGSNGVAILLYEFATGTGQDERAFPLNSDIAQKLVAGDRLTAIKNNFFERLTVLNLSFEQFVANGSSISGGYAFSPDHTTIEESINAHVNANLVQFFIGGTSNSYSPTNQDGWIKVTVYNETSRNSLLLHQGVNYPRTGNGDNKPLSTIKQYFTFLLKVD